ncbi:MAG TPA: DUF2865 domain-containing protein [Roseiarcus sp.]|jgi:hypothetical protein
MADRLVPRHQQFVAPAAPRASAGRQGFHGAVATLVLAGLIALPSEGAGAAGRQARFAGSAPLQVPDNAPRLVILPIDSAAATRPAPQRPPPGPLASRRPVCVRLCDGYFFPLSVAGASSRESQAACSDLCPGAATAVYDLPPGSDRIEDAVSATGAPYTSLDAALRYRSGRAPACSCQATAARRSPYWEDPTLRKGDVVATPSGFQAYRAEAASPFARDNFVSIDQATMPSARRAELATLELAIVPSTDDTQRPQIVAAGPSPKSGGANAIHFVEPLSQTTN